jgi:hypothetical protein
VQSQSNPEEEPFREPGARIMDKRDSRRLKPRLSVLKIPAMYVRGAMVSPFARSVRATVIRVALQQPQPWTGTRKFCDIEWRLPLRRFLSMCAGDCQGKQSRFSQDMLSARGGEHHAPHNDDPGYVR